MKIRESLEECVLIRYLIFVLIFSKAELYQYFQPNKYPWLVRIWNRNGDVYPRWNKCFPRGQSLPGFCGGTLVNSRHVITAGHCTTYKKACYGTYRFHRVDYKAHHIAVRVGYHDISDHTAEGEEMFNVKRIIRHPDYHYRDGERPRNDIAILELEWPVDIMIHTPACLARRTAGSKFDGKMAKAVGWGRFKNHGKLVDQFSHNYPFEVNLQVYPGPVDFVNVTQQSGKGTCKVTKSLIHGMFTFFIRYGSSFLISSSISWVSSTKFYKRFWNHVFIFSGT